jgi:spermidine/putrescine transport system ATP-binding protein
MAEPFLKLVNICKSYDSVQVLRDFNFSINSGEFLSLLGPSGCGKTTIIRLIAGLEEPQSGSVFLDGKRIDGLPPHKRPVNTIFQNYALFPHMNVYDNIAYGLRGKFMKSAAIREKVLRVLEMVQLTGFEKRRPHEMSGGQKQRVSIARAIVNNPPVLLLDEPLTALDLKLRKEMRYELRNLQKKLGITFVYVTHDQEEALVMSDRIAVMNEGIIEQEGEPIELFTRPASTFAAEFIGDNNIFEGMVESAEGSEINVLLETGRVISAGKKFPPGSIINLYVKPDKILWSPEPEGKFCLAGLVTGQFLSGAFVKSTIELDNGKEIRLTRLAGKGLPGPGKKVYVYWEPGDALAFMSRNQPVTAFDISLWKQD